MGVALAVAPVVLMTLLIGVRGVAAMRTTSDFLVASRRISPLVNSAAVSGEYLSAASFLGVAGLVVKDGIGALWYPVGFTARLHRDARAGRRADAALGRADRARLRRGPAQLPALRRLAAVVVLVIGTIYVVPQFRTAGLVLTAVGGTPYWVGVVLAGAAVSVTLALGGMRAATYVQAFQFVLKLLLFLIPAIWLVLQAGAVNRADALNPVEFTHFTRETPVKFEVDVTMVIREPTAAERNGVAETLPPGEFTAHSQDVVVFGEGTAVPAVRGGAPLGGPDWRRPLLDLGDQGYPLLGTWSVLIATMLGTMGLPHVLMRFHTSPDGRAARRTAAITVALLGIFYLFPGIYGVLGRVLVPGLYLSGATDTVVVALPYQVDSGWAAWVLHGVADRGRVRRVPGDVARAAAGDVRGARPRPRAGRAAPAAVRRVRRRRRDGAAGPALGRAGRRGARHVGLHRRRVDVLPAARARHLVAAADRGGRHRRRADRAARVVRLDPVRPRRPAAARLGGDPGAATGTLVGTAGVRRNGVGLPARPAPALGDVRDAPPALGRTPFGQAARPFVNRSSSREAVEPLILHAGLTPPYGDADHISQCRKGAA